MAFPPVSYNERGILAFQKCPQALASEARIEWRRRPVGGLSSGREGKKRRILWKKKRGCPGATAGTAAGGLKGSEVRVLFEMRQAEEPTVARQSRRPSGWWGGALRDFLSMQSVLVPVCVCVYVAVVGGDHTSLKSELNLCTWRRLLTFKHQPSLTNPPLDGHLSR